MLPRRTVEELALIHKLEPTTADLVVEGPSDQRLLDWFVYEHRLAVVVYEVDSFDLSQESLLAQGLENNNRGRVIALARYASEHLPATARFCCVIDNDFDTLLGTTHIYSRLLRTDYSCMEMYAFNPSVVGKFLRLQLPKFKNAAEKILTQLAPPLLDLAAFRLANRLTELALSSVEWERLLDLADGRITLNLVIYRRRCLQKSGKAEYSEIFEIEHDKARTRLVGDSREFVNGHDFTTMFAWYLQQHRGCGRRNSFELRDQLYTAMEHEDLRDMPLFQGIAAQCSRASTQRPSMDDHDDAASKADTGPANVI